MDAVDVSSHEPDVLRALRRMGFKRVGTAHLMYRGAAGSALARVDHRRPENWWVRSGDGDNFFV